MPFQSKAQRAYLEIHHPDVAKEFAKATSKKQERSLPEHKKGKKRKRHISDGTP